MSFIKGIIGKIQLNREKNLRTGSVMRDCFQSTLDEYVTKNPTIKVDRKKIWNAFLNCQIDDDIESIDRFIKKHR